MDIVVPVVEVEDVNSEIEDRYNVFKRYLIHIIVGMESTLFKICWLIKTDASKILRSDCVYELANELVVKYFSELEVDEMLVQVMDSFDEDSEKVLSRVNYWFNKVYFSLDRELLEVEELDTDLKEIANLKNDRYLDSVRELVDTTMDSCKVEIIQSFLELE